MSILVTDEFENLKLYHYDTCDNFSPEELQSTRGIIKNNSVIVCKTNSFIPEIRTDDVEGIKQFITPNCNKTTSFYEAQEGSILRLWYYKEDENVEKHRWFLSTHKRINAFASKWGSRSTYGETFLNCLSKLNLNKNSKKNKSWADDSDEDDTNNSTQSSTTIFEKFCNNLNKNFVYNFLIRNTDINRVVVRGYTEPEIFCLGMYDKTKQFKYIPCDKNFVVPSLPSYSYQSLDKMIIDIEKFDINKVSGILLVTSEGKLIKLVNETYDRLFKLRGNVPNILVRYLELRLNEEQKSEYLHLYNEKNEEFKDIENILTDVSKNVFKKYLARYVYKQFAILPSCQFKIITKLHQLFRSKTITKVTYDEVVKVINTLPSTELYNIIKNYQNNKRDYGNGNFVSQEFKNKIYSSQLN